LPEVAEGTALGTLVVGGGIGGLSLARELSRRALPVRVLEQAPEPAPVGAGIIMNPNAMRVLERNGLADRLRARGWPYWARDTHDHRGRLLARRDYRPLYAAGRLATGTLVHRAHLHEALQEALPAGAVRFGVRVAGVETGADRVRVTAASGERFDADLLVGADGIHSVVRAAVHGPTAPVYMGYRSHRLVVDNRDRIQFFTEFLGRGKRIGLVPISAERLYVWTTFNSPRESDRLGLGSAAELRALFAEFTDPRVTGALGQVASVESVLCTDVEEVHQDPWVKGRVVLLGDAAHALTPNLGQGAGMAMEDAAVLAEELEGAAAGRQSLVAALARYEARRRPRVDTVMRLSREVGEAGQRTGRLACWLRNRRLERESRDPRRVEEGLERLLACPM
jgi:2-polyprenyl-6-methoxyphenol hydroxylase-like FAD-dependent oxidoreductase